MRGYVGYGDVMIHNLNEVAATLVAHANPATTALRLIDPFPFSQGSPAFARQPWATGRNPFRIQGQMPCAA